VVVAGAGRTLLSGESSTFVSRRKLILLVDVSPEEVGFRRKSSSKEGFVMG
jgi:hypothetical protein